MSVGVGREGRVGAILDIRNTSTPIGGGSFFSGFAHLGVLHLTHTIVPTTILVVFFPRLTVTTRNRSLVTDNGAAIGTAFNGSSDIIG